MLYSDHWLRLNLKPKPEWNQFNDFVYTKFILDAEDCTKTLLTMNGNKAQPSVKPIFDNLAKLYVATPSELPDHEWATLKNFQKFNKSMFSVQAILVSDYMNINTEDKITADPQSYIVVDGNHRLLSLAIQMANGVPNNIQVELYLGVLHSLHN